MRKRPGNGVPDLSTLIMSGEVANSITTTQEIREVVSLVLHDMKNMEQNCQRLRTNSAIGKI